MDAARGGLPDPCGGPQSVKALRAGRPGPQGGPRSPGEQVFFAASLRWIRWVAFKGSEDTADAEK